MRRQLSSYLLHTITRACTRALLSVLLLVCLSACETEIEYDNSNDKRQLVLSATVAAGQPISCYVNASTYTLGYTEQDTAYYYYINIYGDTTWSTHPQVLRGKMYLSDAQVQMRINNGEWFGATFNDKTNLYTAPQTLSAGDLVEITASHPDYGTASAQQVVPQPVTINAIHTTDRYPEITPDGWVQFTLDFDTYSGDKDNIIGIRVLEGAFTCQTTKRQGHQEMYYNTYTRDSARHTVYDTITVSDTVPLTFIYSQGDMWNLPFNYADYKDKYYGAYSPKYLYFMASELQQPKQIYMFADQNMGNDIIKRDSLQLQHLSICIDVFPYDYYLYLTSVYSGSYLGSIKIPTGATYDETDEYSGNYMEDILEEMYYLGDQENIQIYTNISGGLGCFATYTPTTLTIK